MNQHATAGPARPGASAWVPGERSLETLRAAAPACRGCELWEPASQVVFSAGRPTARLVLVGEQPGDQEDRAGEPFVGPAGHLLDKALRDAGIDRAEVYVTNAVKHFHFTQSGAGKRRIHQTPELAHLVACRPWLAAELGVVDPEVVVCLGATAAKALLGKDFRVTKSRGQLFPHRASVDAEPSAWLMATLHPSAVLRAGTGLNGEEKQAAHDTAYDSLVADLRVAAAALDAKSTN